MKSNTRWFAVPACALLVSGAGCTAGRASSPAGAPTEAAGSSFSPGTPDLPTGNTAVMLDPAAFSTTITNPYWPMEPGRRWTYRETVEDGTVQEIVVVVTTATKRIANGITARVVRDTVREGGAIVEDTLDWYAQDRDGNVWYLGEDTAEFAGGRISSRGGSFEAGVDGAQPGIAMPGQPRPGLRYRQEYYRGEAEDNGEILGADELVQVPAGAYRQAMLTKDTSGLKPDVQEYKLYAKGVGPVLVLGVSGGGGREELIKLDRARPTDGTGPLGNPNP